MRQARILVVEDDANIREGLLDTLRSEGYDTAATADGAGALARFAEGGIDLVLLDIMLPGMSGYDVVREIRRADARVPVLMLTAKGEEIDKVVGLRLGADDYITKPFGVHELLARVAAALRRAALAEAPPVAPGSDAPAQFAFGHAWVDCRQYRVDNAGAVHDLTERELALLRLFSEHPNEVLRRDFLLDRVWGIKYMGTTRTLDQHIAQLRKKVERDPARPRLIVTVHGIGYRYVPAVE